MIDLMPKWSLFLSSLLLLFSPVTAFAQASSAGSASLKLTPASSSVKVGQSFTAAVKVSATNSSIASIQAYMTYPVDTLEVSSISKTGTIASIFVEEPTFSNTTGSIKMTADIASPGFSGTDGLVATITFKAKAAGTANVNFTTEAAVYPTTGTSSILNSSEGGVYTLTGTAAATGAAVVTTSPTPLPTKAATSSGAPLPETATTGQTAVGIFFGMILIAFAAYLKINRKSSVR